jgi:endo-1,4-beta-xylanase
LKQGHSIIQHERRKCKMRKILLGICVIAVLALAGCPQPNDDPQTTFIPVTAITGVPATAVAETPLTLSGTVEPPDATNQTIVWSVGNAGTTGAVIEDGILTSAAGTVTVIATIAKGLAAGDYTQSFSITVNPLPPPDSVPVSAISGVPSAMVAGTPLTLSGTVEPADATNTTIVWAVKTAGTTGAAISSGNILNAAAAGTLTVTATIAGGKADGGNYTQDFSISVENKAVSAINGVPSVMTAGEPLTLSGTVEPADATNKTIVWTVKTAGSAGAAIDSGNILNASAAGTLTVTATIAGGKADGEDYAQDFNITVALPASIPVSSIVNLPTVMTAGEPLTLSGTVEPADATNKTIVWSIGNAGTTGAAIEGAILNASAAGTLTVTATIAGGKADGGTYTQDFAISVENKAVSAIRNVPTVMAAGAPLTLSGTVEPADATNQTIVWSVGNAGTTGAVIDGATLSAAAGGTVTVTATIAGGKADGGNYTQDFNISVTFKAVSAISGVPSAMVAGTPLTLSGTVEPADATKRTIVWRVGNAGTTGADIDGATLSAAAGGTVTITATIAGGKADGGNYTQDFNISVTFKAVNAISGVPGDMVAGTPLTLSGTVEPADASKRAIVWSVSNPGTTGATLSGNTLRAAAAGTVKVTAAIAGGKADGGNYTQDFDINVIFKDVIGISGVPGTMAAEKPLTLSGAVEPPDATNRTIVWNISNAGTTNATINGAILNAMNSGTVTITATIAGGTYTGDYTESFAIEVIVDPGTLAISVGFNRGIEVTGNSGANIIRKTGSPSSLTLSVDSATGYTGVAWYVDGNTMTAAATGDMFVVEASAYAAQLHSVTFTGIKDGIPYSQLIPFTVFD